MIMVTVMMTKTPMMIMIFCGQVTYAFCKEFASLLSELVTPEGDLPVVKILTTIFEQVRDAIMMILGGNDDIFHGNPV